MGTVQYKLENAIAKTVEQSANTSAQLPIFILGVMPRSGTNYLTNLLCLHIDCSKSAFDEDYFLSHSDYLVKFANALQKQWDLLEDVKDFPTKEKLLESLGKGLIIFLQQSRTDALKTRAENLDINLPLESFNKRIVTKTPFIDNLNRFFEFFPNSPLLILIRDGRAVVESSVKSFQTDPEIVTREWASSVNKVLSFEAEMTNLKNRYLIIRYEDLFTDTEQIMNKVLDFLEIDKNSYDFQQALNLPVVGSSSFGRDVSQSLNWNQKRKTEEFNPLSRAANWSRAQHERFNWLAAAQLEAFGYVPKVYNDNRLFWTIRNVLLDLKWNSKVWIRRFKKASLFVVKRLRAYRSNPSI